MVTIRCKNCGLQEWDIQSIDGTSYLKCQHCNKTTIAKISTKNGRIKIDLY